MRAAADMPAIPPPIIIISVMLASLCQDQVNRGMRILSAQSVDLYFTK
jgi:hypothetical protein